MPGDQAKDSRPPDSITRFRVEVYRSVIDQITSSLEERFIVNRAIILDTSCLDPRRFKELSDCGIPLGSLDKVAELAGLDATSLRSELSVYLLEGTSHCAAHYGKNLTLFRVRI